MSARVLDVLEVSDARQASASELGEANRILTRALEAQSLAFGSGVRAELSPWIEAVRRRARPGAAPTHGAMRVGQVVPAPSIPGLAPDARRRPWDVVEVPYRVTRTAPYPAFPAISPAKSIHATFQNGAGDEAEEVESDFAAWGSVDVARGELRAILAGGRLISETFDPHWSEPMIFQIAQSSTAMRVFFMELPRYSTASLATFDVALDVPEPSVLLLPGSDALGAVGAFAAITLTIASNSPLPPTMQSHRFFQRAAGRDGDEIGTFEPPPWVTGSIVLAPHVTIALVGVQLDLLVARTPPSDPAYANAFAGIEFVDPLSPWNAAANPSLFQWSTPKGPIRVRSISCYSRPLPAGS